MQKINLNYPVLAQTCFGENIYRMIAYHKA
jgi:hypothetical protein